MMQLVSTQQKTINTIDPSNTEQLKIKVNAKAFTVLMDKMYSNKIRAVIRELSTNAYEAHQLLGKESTPFLVTLPSNWDNNFSIRDYGPGLSHHDVMNLYTTFFDSTKDNSNEFGGAFGLGSKSPFAYCDNYIVISIHNGKKSTYILAKNDEGIPTCSLMHSDDSDEPTGLEVKIAVNKNDIYSFKNEAEFVYRFFKTRPTIKGVTVNFLSEKTVVKGDGWETVESGDSYAIMGNVAYSLANYTGLHRDILNIPGMRLIFNIGEIEPQPNREGLSFNKNTLLSIEKKLAKIKESVEKIAKEDIDKKDCWWNAYLDYRKIKAKYSFIKLNFNGRSLDESYFPKKIVQEIDKISNKTISVSRPDNYLAQDSRGKPFESNYVTPTEYICFIVEDKCTHLRQRIKNYLLDKGYNRAYLIPDGEKKKWVDNFGITDKMVILASSLPKPEKVQQESKRHRSKVMQYKMNNTSHYAGSYWEDKEVDLENDSGYYIGIFSNKVMYKDVEIAPDKLKELLSFMKLTGDIYGVKKAHLEKVTSKNMQNLETEIENFFKKNTILMEKLYHANSDWNEVRYHQLIKVVQASPTFSQYFGGLDKDVIELEKLAADYNKHYQMLNLFYAWNVTSNFQQTRTNPVKAKLDLYNKKYPLLKAINHYEIPNLIKDIECYLVGMQKGI